MDLQPAHHPLTLLENSAVMLTIGAAALLSAVAMTLMATHPRALTPPPGIDKVFQRTEAQAEWLTVDPTANPKFE